MSFRPSKDLLKAINQNLFEGLENVFAGFKGDSIVGRQEDQGIHPEDNKCWEVVLWQFSFCSAL